MYFYWDNNLCFVLLFRNPLYIKNIYFLLYRMKIFFKFVSHICFFSTIQNFKILWNYIYYLKTFLVTWLHSKIIKIFHHILSYFNHFIMFKYLVHLAFFFFFRSKEEKDLLNPAHWQIFIYEMLKYHIHLFSFFF